MEGAYGTTLSGGCDGFFDIIEGQLRGRFEASSKVPKGEFE